MWIQSVVVVCSFLFVVSPPPAVRADGPAAYELQYHEPANYAFQYAVKDDYANLDFKADENRVAENTAGSYEVLLPDGRVQTVVYKVNGEEGGYLAEVSYNGEPVYPVEPVAAPVHASRPVAYRRLPTANYQPTAAPVKEEPVEAETDAPVATEASTTSRPTPSYRVQVAPVHRVRPVQYAPKPYRLVAVAPSNRHYSPVRASRVYKSRLSYKAAPTEEVEEPEQAEEAVIEEEVEKVETPASTTASYPVNRYSYRQRSTTQAPPEAAAAEERKAKSSDSVPAKANAIPAEPAKRRSTTTTTTTSTTTTAATTTTTPAPTTPVTKSPTTVRAYKLKSVSSTAAAAKEAAAPATTPESILAEAEADAAVAETKAKQTKRWLSLVRQFGNFGSGYFY